MRELLGHRRLHLFEESKVIGDGARPCGRAFELYGAHFRSVLRIDEGFRFGLDIAKIAFEPFDAAMEDIDEAPADILDISVERGPIEHVAEMGDERRGRAREVAILRQRIVFDRRGAGAVEREVVDDAARGGLNREVGFESHERSPCSPRRGPSP